MREGLRIVPERQILARVELFGEQESGPAASRRTRQWSSAQVHLAALRERFDQPERAEKVGTLGTPQTVIPFVPVEEGAPANSFSTAAMVRNTRGSFGGRNPVMGIRNVLASRNGRSNTWTKTSRWSS